MDCFKESSKNTCTTAGDFEKGMYRAVTTGAFGTEVSNCLFVCLYVVFRQTRECFTHTETSTLTMKSIATYMYTRHSTPWSNEWLTMGTTPTVTRYICLFCNLRRQCHSNLMPSVLQCICHYLFDDFGFSRPGVEIRYPACETNAIPTGGSGMFDCCIIIISIMVREILI